MRHLCLRKNLALKNRRFRRRLVAEIVPTLSTPRVAQGGTVVPVGRDGRQLRRDVRRHERSRPPARRASRETSSCRARRRRPASGRTFRTWATSAASSAVVFPVSGPKLNVFRRVPSAPLTVPLDARHASPSPSGRSGTPSSETAHRFASFRLAVHGLLLLRPPALARPRQQTLEARRGHAPQPLEDFSPVACNGTGA